MTDELIEIHWASGSLDEARRISRYLVQEGLVACAQIVPWVESIYLWNNKMDTTQESLVILKSSSSFFDRIKELIESNCQYEIPQITSIPLVNCNPSYRDWLLQSLSTKK